MKLWKAILSRLKKISHVEIVRINTRIPVTLPERITGGLCRMMKRFHPLYVNTHFNHPAEITEESGEACAQAGRCGDSSRKSDGIAAGA